MKIMSKIALLVPIIIIFFGIGVSAGQDPTFETRSAVAVQTNSAVLRAEFDSHNNDYNPSDQPVVWFEYGQDSDNLNNETFSEAKQKGNYIVSSSLIGLNENTEYWFRAVISFDGSVDQGDEISFITAERQVSGTANSNFLSPDELLNQYKEGINGSISTGQNQDNTNTTTTFKNGVAKNTDNGPLSFASFWDWVRGRKPKVQEDNQDQNLVQTEEEIDAAIAEEEARKAKLSEQKKYNNSAANDDELGEIIEYNTKYKNNYKQGKIKQRSVSGGNTLNHPMLLFIVLLLGLALFMITMIMRKRKRVLAHHNKMRRPVQNMEQGSNPAAQGQGRYYIPVKRDLHDPKQNPNTSFFRRPSKK